MTPLRVTFAAAALVAAASVPAGAASHDCAQDALRNAQSGSVKAYYPTRCYDAARAANGSAGAAVTSRLRAGRARDVKRHLSGKVTGVDNVAHGKTLLLHVQMTLPVRDLRVTLLRSTANGGTQVVSTSYLNGSSMQLPVHTSTPGTMVLRVNLGFVLDGKVIGAATSPRLVIHVT